MDDDERKARNRAKSRKYREKNLEKCRERTRVWYAANKEKGIACSVAYQQAHKAELKEYRAKRYRENRERLLAEGKEWRKKYPDKMKAAKASWLNRNRDLAAESSRRRHAANKDKANASSKAWRQSNPEAKRAHYHTRRARKKNAVGRYIADDIATIFSMQRGKCAYCRTSIKDAYDIDHIIPLSRGGTNWPRNIQLTCEPCNQKKHASDPVVFARRTGRLI